MNEIDKVLTRGVEAILPSKDGLAELMTKRKITLYQGFDPSSPSLHIGNLIGVRKLAQFQKLGHKVIFLIGDFTGMIGDPTDKSAARKKLAKAEVLENAKGWKKQIEKVLKFEGPNAAEIKFNSEWLSKLTPEEIIDLASNFTVQQINERDFFQERLKNDKEIYIHEFLYPLFQGYDSVAMDVDLEIGGNDQLFNMLAGRTLMQKLGKKEKFVLAMKLLTDPSGKKMGKTEENTINLTDSPSNMFGKIMALPDTLTDPAVELLTDLPLDFAKDKNPMEAKKALASEIVTQVHGEKEATQAQDYFEKTFQKREPQYWSEILLMDTLAGTISQIDSVGSVSQAKRLVTGGAVDVGGATITDPSYKPQSGDEIKIGKKTFVKIK